jgi:hypothetical protein
VGGTTGDGAFTHGDKDFRGNDYFIPVGVVFYRTTKNFLAIAVGIGIGCIEEIDP